MVNKDSTIKDIVSVTFSNFISLLSSILNGFVIPVILGPLNYGYYKIFTLYASYTVLFHFGFNDGILLSYGGKHYDDLNKYDFRSNSLFFIIFQFIVALIIASMWLFTTNHFYRILFLLLSINDFTQNLLVYYQNISQTIMRFTEYSTINIIQYLSLIVSVFSILFYCKLYKLRNVSFVPYVVIIICINICLVLWYLYDYREITFGKHVSLFKKFNSFKKYFISGFYMTFGYGISVLISNLDSQFVLILFNTKIYGIYAFSYSMFTAGFTILGSAAVVLLPHLKQHSSSYILKKYSKNITYVSLLAYLAISGYFLLRIIIYKFIAGYSSSLIYFRLLLPGMVIACCVSIVIANYYYALSKVKFYFVLSVLVLIITFIMDVIFYLIFKSPESLSLSSTLSLLIWYVITNYFIVKKYKIHFIKNIIYLIVMMIGFWSFSRIDNLYLGTCSYIIFYFIVSFGLFKNTLISLMKHVIYGIL